MLGFETLNPPPFGFKFFAITKRPLLLPFFGELSRHLKKFSLNTNSSKFYNSKFNLFSYMMENKRQKNYKRTSVVSNSSCEQETTYKLFLLFLQT